MKHSPRVKASDLPEHVRQSLGLQPARKPPRKGKAGPRLERLAPMGRGESLSLTVDHQPEPQPRHTYPKAGMPFIPKDSPVHGYKRTARRRAKEAMAGRPPWGGPLSVEITFVMPALKGRERSQGAWHDVKPDIDNMEKATLDALNRVVWGDDGQVCRLVAVKRRARPGERPCAIILVSPANEVPS